MVDFFISLHLLLFWFENIHINVLFCPFFFFLGYFLPHRSICRCWGVAKGPSGLVDFIQQHTCRDHSPRTCRMGGVTLNRHLTITILQIQRLIRNHHIIDVRNSECSTWCQCMHGWTTKRAKVAAVNDVFSHNKRFYLKKQSQKKNGENLLKSLPTDAIHTRASQSYIRKRQIIALQNHN